MRRRGSRPTAVAPVVDAAAATFRRLAAPLNFPPLSQGVVPGDRLAIAVDETTPCLAGIVRGTIDAALEAGIEPDAISVVATDGRRWSRCRAELEACGERRHSIRRSRSGG